MRDSSFIRNKAIVKEFEEIEDGKPDMQGLLIRGYAKLKCAKYFFLEIMEVKPALTYFKNLLPLITTADKSSEEFVQEADKNFAFNIAFSSKGLEKIELDKDLLKTFSREFNEGMSFNHADPNIIAERPTLLGDVGDADPANWRWGNNDHPVHCVLMLYAIDQAGLQQITTKVYPNTSIIKVVHTGCTYAFPDDQVKEHFGFADGISQPIIRGVKKSFDLEEESKMIYAGEFILGYKNEYQNFSPSPYMIKGDEKIDFGKNGSYLVFRQIEQHVKKFWKYNYQVSKEGGETKSDKAIKLAAKMVGRWPDGKPLVRCPMIDCELDKEELNNFTYSGPDKLGENCPFGAHIRRTNPRDQVHTGRDAKQSLEMTKKHRMLRRGRIYGLPLENFDIKKILNQIENSDTTNLCAESSAKFSEGKHNDPRTDINTGLHFICIVSDIGRQFEFVQNVWGNTATFADLSNEVDPLISPRPTKDQPLCTEFTTPQKIIRNRYTKVPEFTTVVGGEYFFMPSITALKLIFQITG